MSTVLADVCDVSVVDTVWAAAAPQPESTRLKIIMLAIVIAAIFFIAVFFLFLSVLFILFSFIE